MALFRDLGPYSIVRQIGRGMNPVFLATDTRSGDAVALKVVAIGSDEDDREILAAEEQGATLQARFADRSEYVPRVYEVGHVGDYFYIAMEYIDGEDLSTVLARGPLAPARAVAIAAQLCRFLEQVDRIAGEEGESVLTLLHNDLKPGNIRLQTGDRVKILDFGAAKVLSLTKRVTRNVFGSIPYLSPECLETGKRDRFTDAWAVGVLLYEMVAGRTPFRASDTISLERRIRSRRPPDEPVGLPDALREVLARLLAPYPAARYESATAIRTDLERVLAAGELPATADAPATARDVEPVTRRTREPLSEDEPPTRRVVPATDGEGPEVADEAPTRRVAAPVEAAASVAEMGPADRPSGAPLAETRPLRRRTQRARRAILAAVMVTLAVLAFTEMATARRASALAATVPQEEFDGLTRAWTEYQSLAGHSVLGFGVRGLGRQLHRQSQVLADRVIANYRSPAPTVREAQWQAAATALRRALTIDPDDDGMRAALRYAEGHLHRIDGDAQKARGQVDSARREFAEAVTAFREAAALRSDWPDPFLGLARTFIYGVEDIDRGADAIREAERLGFQMGPRETAQLGDGYRTRGELLQRTAATLDELPQARESLTRAADAYKKALDLYSSVADYTDVAARIRQTQARLATVERELERTADPRSPIDRLIGALSGAF